MGAQTAPHQPTSARGALHHDRCCSRRSQMRSPQAAGTPTRATGATRTRSSVAQWTRRHVRSLPQLRSTQSRQACTTPRDPRDHHLRMSALTRIPRRAPQRMRVSQDRMMVQSETTADSRRSPRFYVRRDCEVWRRPRVNEVLKSTGNGDSS